ncbi:MAG: DNA polymerase III subunit gamma/tau [Armatimonadota bacterium]
MPYLSLYRKYRPRTFAEIVGQRHVTQTLVNALKANRIAHAYLFCGPRGTGKTSTARVLAMALNCEHGPTPDPCGECESCRRIIAGSALDVIEIDAASNRGIDEIRELRERVGLAAADARMKVYIIDEVHMLTPEAYNAFLKTLEEPPAHVVFVLATTEPHRVLPTILSRCQRFDFHRVGLRDLEMTIRSVASKENLRVEERAVAMLAHAADGAARDALTLLDQAASYAVDDITVEVVTEILGGIDFDLVAEFTDVLIRQEVAGALAFIERVVAEGKDLRQLVGNLIEHFRDLLLLSVDPSAKETLALPEEALAKAAEQAGELSQRRVLQVLGTLAETDRELRFTSQPRLLVELAAVRLCREEATASAVVPAEAAPARARAAEPARPRRAREEPQEAPPGPPSADQAAMPSGLAEIRQRWEEVMAELRKAGKHSEGAFLRESVPVSLEDGVLTLEFSHQFHHDQMMSDKRREAVAEIVQRLFGVEVRVKCRMAPEGAAKAGGPPKGQKAKGRSSLDDVLSIFPGSEVEE